MREIQALLRAVSSIYSAPGNDARWGEVIGEVCELVGAVEGAYLLINPEDLSTAGFATSGYSDEHIRRYAGYGGASTDIRFKYIDRLVPGRVFREFEYVPDRSEYDASDWIKYQLATTGTYWCMSARISTHGLWHDYITVNRKHALGAHTDAQKADLQDLLPHLGRAAELHRTMSRLTQRFGAVLGVLDMLMVGLVLLDDQGRVAIANRAAREVCEGTGAISLLADGRVRAWQPASDAKLQRLIADTAAAATGKGQSDGGSVVIAKRQGKGCVLAEMTPLRDDGFADGDRLAGTALFLLDPESSRGISMEGLARIFGLTPTEHAVASDLAAGSSPAEIAEQRSRSVETIRSQIKRIFSKTGANSQVELLRLAAKLTPPIRSN